MHVVQNVVSFLVPKGFVVLSEPAHQRQIVQDHPLAIHKPCLLLGVYGIDVPIVDVRSDLSE